MSIEDMGIRARAAAKALRIADPKSKTEALNAIADALISNQDDILAANAIDMEAAEKNGMIKSMQDRLLLTPERIEGMAKAARDVAAWPDPVGALIEERTLPNGIDVKRVSVPLGVIGIIFESRPNVTSDCACLCIRAGNAVILRGGHEAFNSNNAVTGVMRKALAASGLPEDSVQLVKDLSHESAGELMNMTKYVDVLIPRGSARLINRVLDEAKVPVIQTGAGNCHIYVDKEADPDMARDIVVNAKTQRPSVCNAAETLLIHQDIAGDVAPAILKALIEKGTEVRGDGMIRELCPGLDITPAEDEDWQTEYDDLIIAVKVVSDIDEAVDHIEKYSTSHSECIVTRDQESAEKFLSEIDSAAVYWNASTRFTDGGEMGLGAEIGISTQKLHARGPMGVDQLVTYKYELIGTGQIR